MATWPFSDEGVRAMYSDGRAGTAARRMAHFWAVVFRLGLFPRRWVTLEVVGRHSGMPRRFPLGMADVGGEWYVVSMLGECDWVRNVRAAGGVATVWHGRPTACRLEEVPVADRAPILRRYLEKVPGGRPHIPVGRGAPLSALAGVASGYPIFRVSPVAGGAAVGVGGAAASGAGVGSRASGASGASGAGAPGACAVPAARRRRRRARRILISLVLVILGLLVAGGLYVKLQPTPPALALPSTAASAPRGPLAGTWHVGSGSVAGFRVPETVAFMTGTVVGRTDSVTGSLVVTGDKVTSATFVVDVEAVTVGGKASSGLASALDVSKDPTAVFRLRGAVDLGPAFVTGGRISTVAAGSLLLCGTTRSVRVTISGRRSGTELEVAASVPIRFAGWGIARPAGFGPLGSLADHGVAEMYLVLRQG